MGLLSRHRALGTPGRCVVLSGRGQQRNPGYTHGLGQVAGRARHDVHGHGQRTARILHGAHQSSRFREILLPGRHPRPRQRGHDHRRLAHQHRRPRHLLHRRDPCQPSVARGRRHRCGLRRHGRIPLLLRPRPRMGLAGPTAHIAPHAVPAHERHPGRHDRHRRYPHPHHRPRPGAHRRRSAPGAPLLRIRKNRPGRNGRTRASPRRLTALYRALLPGRGWRATALPAKSSARRSRRPSREGASLRRSAKRSGTSSRAAWGYTTPACYPATACSSRSSPSRAFFL